MRGGKGELQSRSLTWGARVMFKRQFWHPADPGSHLLQPPPPSCRGAPTPSGRRYHPFGILMSPFRGGLPRLLLTDRTKLASPVPPKPGHWNCTQYIAGFWRRRCRAMRLLRAIYRIELYALLKRWPLYVVDAR